MYMNKKRRHPYSKHRLSKCISTKNKLIIDTRIEILSTKHPSVNHTKLKNIK